MAWGGGYESIGPGRVVTVGRAVLTCALLLVGASFLHVFHEKNGALALEAAAASGACATTGGTTTCRYGGDAFWAVDGVRAYFRRVGVSREDALRVYLPSYSVTYGVEIEMFPGDVRTMGPSWERIWRER